MPTAANARLQMEINETAVATGLLTDSGDATTFTSGATLWSKRTGFTPTVLPNGILTGGTVTPTTTNNQVSITAMVVYLNGVVTAVGAGTLSAVRTAAGGAFEKTSLTVDSGGSLAAVGGTESTAFSETRGGNGGPPYIAVDSVEIAQVHLSSNTDAVVDVSEIKTVPNQHREEATFPLWTVDYANGQITFTEALMLNHTSDVPKRVYASYSTPTFATIPDANTVVPPEVTFSVSSTQTYDRVVNASSQALSQGTFDALLETGVSDILVRLKGNNLWFKFFPERTKSQHILFQGLLGISRSFPADDLISVSCTISSEEASVDKES